jgi:tetratricopeptide (TPR) repeat protein
VQRAPILSIVGCLAALVLAAACSRDEPAGDLERFRARLDALPSEAARDTLNRLAQAGGTVAAFARYELGNRFYAAAGDTAQRRGWNDELASALLDSAEVWFTAAIAADSTLVPAYVNLGSLWDDRADMMVPRAEREARIARARDMYERALALDPHDEKARCNLGTLHKRQNDLQAAMREYLAVLEHDPRSALARYNLAILFATMRIYREAVREFELAVKYDPQGDIGERSRANIQIIKDLQAAESGRAARP